MVFLGLARHDLRAAAIDKAPTRKRHATDEHSALQRFAVGQGHFDRPLKTRYVQRGFNHRPRFNMSIGRPNTSVAKQFCIAMKGGLLLIVIPKNKKPDPRLTIPAKLFYPFGMQ
jgi:hypothetical protein